MIYRNKKFLEIVRESPCQNCGIQDGTICAATAFTLLRERLEK
jgi:hypothetical protein